MEMVDFDKEVFFYYDRRGECTLNWKELNKHVVNRL